MDSGLSISPTSSTCQAQTETVASLCAKIRELELHLFTADPNSRAGLLLAEARLFLERARFEMAKEAT